MRIPVEHLQKTLFELFVKYKFENHQAESLARVFTENTLMGVSSHGINRVPLFIQLVKEGIVRVNAVPEKIAAMGSIERWDGNFGSGIINAQICTNRAIELAKAYGMGLVALRNTNHWMRGGAYGWQAADAGCISILFTNTKPNMPAWGGKDCRIGNNPLVISIPRSKGHVVLDMALSQYSFGKIEQYKNRGEQLPYTGGWNDENELSRDPEQILKKERGLPIGYWKGSALSMVLDMIATLLSAGNSTGKIGLKPVETGISQVFLCIYPNLFGDQHLQEKLVKEIIDYTHSSQPMQPGYRTFYPGEQALKTKLQNLKNGIPVDENIWREVVEL